MVAPSTVSTVERDGQGSSIFGPISQLTRDQCEHLLVLLQERLDGGPFVGDIPEVPGEPVADATDAWRAEFDRRLTDMLEGRVPKIDAQGSAARLVQRAEQRLAPWNT